MDAVEHEAALQQAAGSPHTPVAARVASPTPSFTPHSSTKPPNWAKLTQVELRTLLQCFGLPTVGNKAALVSRLASHTGSGAAGSDAGGRSDGATPERHTPVSRRKARPAREGEDATHRAHRPQIASFDIETTIPRFGGDGCHLLEFGALVVDGNSLVEYPELSFETLVRPDDLNAITKRSIDCNHITAAMVAHAPAFRSVAQQIFDVLDGRIWLGHNIVQFDIPHLTRHFELAGLPVPQPLGVIDTLPLLREHFGKRAGNMTMASLGRFFGQGEEEHRALADARMTMEVVKHAGALLFLEERSVFPTLDPEPEQAAEPEPEREVEPDPKREAQ